MATEKRLIYLDEAIAKIKDDGLLGFGYSDDEREDDVIDMLESCHIVDAVEVVHGRWERKHDGARFVCSNCRLVKVSYEMLSFFISTGRWKYCPNCGAKMDGNGNGI